MEAFIILFLDRKERRALIMLFVADVKLLLI